MKRISATLIVVLVISAALLAGSPADATRHGANGRIAFRRYFNKAQTWGAIFTIDPNGSGERQVTHPTRGTLTTTADWSPNGRWITYRRDREGFPTLLFRIRANGTHRINLSAATEGRGAAWEGDRGAAWAPGGKRIAFVRGFDRPRGGPDVFVMRLDGTHLRQITDPAGRYEDFGPQWSPDATHIAFKRYTESECGCPHANRAALFTVRLDGTHLRRLTPWKLDGGNEPDYSPDGRWILFSSHECCGEPNNLWVVHPNGSELHRVTQNPGRAFVWGMGSFSPDGRMIVCNRAPGIGSAGNPDVYVMNADGSGLRNVTSSVAWDSESDWGPQRR